MHQTPEKIVNSETHLQDQSSRDTLKVLLIEDSLDDRLLVESTLAKAEHFQVKVLHAGSLSDALDCLYSERFGAILLDMDLPDSSGLDSLEALHLAASHVPVLALIELEDDALAMSALRVGAQDTLVKHQLTAHSLERALLYAIARKRADRPTRISEERFRGLFEQSPIPISIFSPDGRWLKYNQAVAERFGVVVERMASYNALQDEQIADAGMMPYIRKAFDGEATEIPLMSFTSSTSGIPHWLRAFAYPIKDESGEVSEVVSVFQDVTEQKYIEDTLRQKEAQYRAIFEATTDGLVINDLDGNVVEVNPAFCKMHGYTREELLGLSPAVFIHPDYHTTLQEYIETTRAGGQYQCQAVDLHKDGTAFHVEVHGSAFMYNGQPHILGVVRDITERMQAYELLEQRVQERTRELSTLLEVSQNMASMLELKPLLSRILDQLRLVADYSSCAISVVKGAKVELLDLRGSGPQALRRDFLLEQFGPIWEVVQRGEPVVISDVRGDDVYSQTYREINAWLLEITIPEIERRLETDLSNVRSWLAVPLTLKERTIGTLSISHREPNYYTDKHIQFAMAIANQAAIAIENARLYEQAQETARDAAAVEERQRLARELHDSVSQAIFSISLQTRTALTLLKRDLPRAEEPLEHISSLAQIAMAEMRALIFELRPESIKTEGLVAALDKHATALAARHNIEVQTQLGDEPTLPVEAKEVAYRVAQEASHNTIKHAGATRLSIKLSQSSDWVTLEVQDNGIGFDATGQFPGHLGLQSMSERAAMLGGTLDIDSAPGQGTTVRLRIPVS